MSTSPTRRRRATTLQSLEGHSDVPAGPSTDGSTPREQRIKLEAISRPDPENPGADPIPRTITRNANTPLYNDFKFDLHTEDTHPNFSLGYHAPTPQATTSTTNTSILNTAPPATRPTASLSLAISPRPRLALFPTDLPPRLARPILSTRLRHYWTRPSPSDIEMGTLTASAESPRLGTDGQAADQRRRGEEHQGEGERIRRRRWRVWSAVCVVGGVGVSALIMGLAGGE